MTSDLRARLSIIKHQASKIQQQASKIQQQAERSADVLTPESILISELAHLIHYVVAVLDKHLETGEQ